MAETDASTPRSASANANPSPSGRPTGIMGLLSERRVDLTLNVLRLFVIIFSISYIFGLSNEAFSKALLAMAAASALRLYQRSREPSARGERSFSQTMQSLFGEDSCHYLLYCMLFLVGSPITFVLLPICMFAFLHSMTFFSKLSNETGVATGVMRKIGNFIQSETQRMLLAAALGEIIMMVMAVIMALSGRINLLAPFLYFRFLQLRYASRRNPYSRTAFYQLRLASERLAQQAPPAIGSIIFKGISLVSRLAPAAQAQ